MCVTAFKQRTHTLWEPYILQSAASVHAILVRLPWSDGAPGMSSVPRRGAEAAAAATFDLRPQSIPPKLSQSSPQIEQEALLALWTCLTLWRSSAALHQMAEKYNVIKHNTLL